MKIITILITTFILYGCFGSNTTKSQTRVNGATEETTIRTIKKIYSEQGNKNTCLLQAAIMRIQIGDRAQQIKKTGNKDAVSTPLGPKIHGMNYDEIINYSKNYPNAVTPLCRD